MLIAAGIGAVVYFSQNLPDEIRQHVQAKLAGHYPQLRIEVHSAQLLPEEGILIRGLTILDPAAPKAEQILVSVDEVLLACQTSLTELVQGEPEISHMILRRPRIIARVDAQGKWNLSKLTSSPNFSKKSVELTLEGGQVEIHDPRRTPAALYTVRDIQCALTPQMVVEQQIEPAWEVRGKLRGDALRQVEFQGRVEPYFTTARLQCSLVGLQFSPEWCAMLPHEVADPLQAISMLRGEIQLTSELQYNAQATQPVQFIVNGQLTGGRIDDARLPQPLNDVKATFSADRNGCAIQELTAENGRTKLRLAAERRGYSANAPLSVVLEAKHLTLDRSWENFLPGPAKETWLKFTPSGEVHVNGRLDYDGQRWQPSGTINCLNVSFTYHQFPYRMHHTQGTMHWANQRIQGQLETTCGNKRAAITIDVTNPGEQFLGSVKLSGTGFTLDQNMLAALPEKPRQIVNSLNPVGGNFDLALTISRQTVDQPKPKLTIRWDLHQVGIKYDKFKYPLLDVSGRVEMQDQYWQFKDLVGTNDKGKVTCAGTLEPIEQGSELKLKFVGSEISLEDELRDALPAQAQAFWKNLNPRGFIDLTADFNYRTAEQKSTLNLVATPLGDTVVIEPTSFPLRMEKVRGTFRYKPNRVDFEKVTAEYDHLPLVAQGYCENDALGAWHLRFDKLIADRVRPERAAMQAALPSRLRKVVQNMQLAGPLNLSGSCDLWNNPEQPEPLTAAWDMQVDVRDGSISCSQKLEHIDGAVRLVGQATNSKLRMQGELNLDSLMTNELHLTQVRGPLWVDETQVLIGSGALPANVAQRRNLTAKCYGGTLTTDAWLKLGEQPRFAVQARLDDLSLAQFGREQLPGKQNLGGKVQVGLELNGTTAGIHTLAGRGQAFLTDANLGELPVMLAMLKILSIREPDRTAFDSGDINFRIEGEHVYFDTIELTGNAISLLGTGEMNLQRELQLVFSAVAGRSDWQIPVIKSVLGQASQQFMEIQVGGTLADPEIKREAFPALKQSLDQLQAERKQRKIPR